MQLSKNRPGLPLTLLDSWYLDDEGFHLVLEAREAPADELLAQSLRVAAEARPEPERMEFLVAAGRELAGLLGRDPLRLESLLRQIRPKDITMDTISCLLRYPWRTFTALAIPA